MSDHVVVKRKLLESVLRDWIQFGCLTTPTCKGVQAVIDSTSPEMVPMSEVAEILDILNRMIPHIEPDIFNNPDRFVYLKTEAETALDAFNAKFKV